MATSGTTLYTYTRDQIINAALRKLVVLGEGVSANATQLSTGMEALNLLILQLQALGMPLWKRTTLAIPMVAGTSSYTLQVPKALKIEQAYRTYTADLTHVYMDIMPSYDFNLLPQNSTGIPVNVTYQPLNTTGTLRVWPTPDSSIPAGTAVTVVYQAATEVFTSGTETLDFPPEWLNTVVYQLALLLAPEYAIPTQDQQLMEKQAEKHLATVLGMAQEDGSVYFQPNPN